MDRTSSNGSKLSYVSCMKINGKPIIPPLMTPERRVEMQRYRELAMTVDARLQGWTRKDSSPKRSSVDSGVTMLSGTEHASSDHPLCSNRRVDSGCVGETESVMITSEERASLNTTEIKSLVPCSELEQRGHKTVTNSDLMSGSNRMLGSFQQDGTHSNLALLVGSTQQHVVQHDCSEVENRMQHIIVDVRDTGGLCLENKDSAAQNSKTGGVLISIPDKCGPENMEQSSGFSLSDSTFDSDYGGYKPWEKVHGGNISNEGKKVLKLQQENVSGMNGNQQGLEQAVGDSDVNGNLVRSTQQRQINTGIRCCLTDNFLTPVNQNVKLKSTFLISGNDDHGHKCGSSNNASEARGECVNYKIFTSQNQINSKNPIEHVQFQTGVNGTFLSHSQKTDKTNTPIQNVPCVSKDTYSSDNISKPVKIREGILDISDSLRSESCGNEESVTFSTLESDRSAVMNTCSFSRHSSAESTGLTYTSTSTPHLLTHDNLEDSVSSVVMTSSTDLNLYMNTSGSSGSVSSDQDVAALHNSKWTGQDELHGTSNIAALQRSLLSKNTFSGQHLQLTSVCEPNLILHHNSLSDQIEEQKCLQNIDDDKLGTNSNKENVCVAEKVSMWNDLPDGLKMTCPVSTACATCDASNFNESCKNVNCHVGNQLKCLTVPKVKLQHKTVDKHDDLETSLSSQNKFAHDSGSTEENVNKISEWNVLKPETTPPRLVRQNSYTLIAPSPLLVAHMKMQNGKNSVHDMTERSNISTEPCRKVWESNGKKGNSLLASPNGNANSGKKINSSVVSSAISASLTHHQLHQNSSLPTSNTSSPIKLQTPFASLDCLPSAVFTESVKTFPQPSPRMKNKRTRKSSISSAASKETKTSEISQKKSPTKIPRKDIPMGNPSIASQGSPKKISKAEAVPLSTRQDVQGLILHLQSEHSKQMAALLAKQRMEQEELRKAFLQQQNELVLEVCKVYSAPFHAPGSQKQLSQQTPSSDHLTRHENESFNSSMNRVASDLSSKSLSLGSADTLETSTHDMCDKCVLLDTNFRRLTSISPSTDLGQNVADNSLYQDPLQDRTQGLNEMTPRLQESSHKDKPVKEVLQNALQDGSYFRLSESDTTERCLPEHSFHPCITESTSPQILVPQELDILQKHDSDSAEENTRNKVDIHNVNSAVPPPSCTSGVVSNLPASESASMPRTEAEFPPGSVPSSIFVHGYNGVDTKDRQNDSIQSRSPCIRQLFPALEEGGALHETPPLNRCDLEKIAATRITAAARGFLTRRLFRTAHVQNIILTIRDTLLCAVQMHRDCGSNVTPEDVALHRRLIQQVTAACYALHGVFFNLPISKQMAIIAADRDRIRKQTRQPVPQPLSAATRRTIERKMLQRCSSCFPKNHPVRATCTLHRIRSSQIDKSTHSRSYEVRQHQQTQLRGMTNRHSLDMNSRRKPWR